ncbi:MAG: hypothetical protein XU14_C0099G0004 [Armatimonadetes bacterium CSP1-3]|nr:MAG: hypothetical protein XU14_C0099G0004 [Armatimonadetes bacterium CSP1-3]
MKRTHLSLYYLFAYLIVAGVALILAPQLALKLLLSNGNYGDVFPRLLGVVLLALGILILQIVRHRVEVLYPWTLVVRAMILVVLLGLYVYARDPFFLVLMGVVALGVVLTGISYFRDRRR